MGGARAGRQPVRGPRRPRGGLRNVPGPRRRAAGVQALLRVGHRRARRPDRLAHDLLDTQERRSWPLSSGPRAGALSPDAGGARRARQAADRLERLPHSRHRRRRRVPVGLAVRYAAASYTEPLWASSPDARHSRHLAARREAGIVIFDSRATLGEAQAVYMTAEAEELTLRARAVHRGLSRRPGGASAGMDARGRGCAGTPAPLPRERHRDIRARQHRRHAPGRPPDSGRA